MDCEWLPGSMELSFFSQVVKLATTACKSLGIVLKTYEWLDIQVQILSWLLECWVGLCMPQQPLQRWIHTQQESYNGSIGHFQCSDESSILFSCTNELQNSYKGITLAYHVSDEGSSPSFCSNKLGNGIARVITSLAPRKSRRIRIPYSPQRV